MLRQHGHAMNTYTSTQHVLVQWQVEPTEPLIHFPFRYPISMLSSVEILLQNRGLN